MMLLMANWKKFLCGLCLCAALGGSFWLGWRAAPKPTATLTDKKTTKTNKVTTTIKKPDGSSKTVVEEQSETQESKTKEASKYRLGVLAETKASDLKEGKFDPKYAVTASVRLVKSLWLDAQYGFSDKSIGLGLSWEW